MHFSLQLKLGGWPTFDFAIQGCINQAISQERSSPAQNLLTKNLSKPSSTNTVADGWGGGASLRVGSGRMTAASGLTQVKP